MPAFPLKVISKHKKYFRFQVVASKSHQNLFQNDYSDKQLMIVKELWVHLSIFCRKKKYRHYIARLKKHRSNYSISFFTVRLRAVQ